jgi:hypothetical protein
VQTFTNIESLGFTAMNVVYRISRTDDCACFACPVALQDYFDSVLPGRYNVDLLMGHSETPQGSVVKYENGEFDLQRNVRREPSDE